MARSPAPLTSSAFIQLGHIGEQNLGPTFAVRGPKYTELSLPVREVSVVCNAVFRLTMSCCFPEILAISSRSCAKSRRNLVFLGRQILGEGPPKFLTEFYKSRSPSNMWQSLVTIGQLYTAAVIMANMRTFLVTGPSVTQNLPFRHETAVILSIAFTHYAYPGKDGQAELALVAWLNTKIV